MIKDKLLNKGVAMSCRAYFFIFGIFNVVQFIFIKILHVKINIVREIWLCTMSTNLFVMNSTKGWKLQNYENFKPFPTDILGVGLTEFISEDPMSRAT